MSSSNNNTNNNNNNNNTNDDRQQQQQKQQYDGIKQQQQHQGGGNNVVTTTVRRYIYNDDDMKQFHASDIKIQLMKFTSALGRSCASGGGGGGGCTTANNISTSKALSKQQQQQQEKLIGLSPSISVLYGALRCMNENWLKEIPPIIKDSNKMSRFGNRAFVTWHNRLVKRSKRIIRTILQTRDTIEQEQSNNHADEEDDDDDDDFEYDVSLLQEAADRGYRAAFAADDDDDGDDYVEKNDEQDDDDKNNNSNDKMKKLNKRDVIIDELSAYLQASFGHPIRLDYGTGHESSFHVLLFSLFKLGCFGGSFQRHDDEEDDPKTSNNNTSEVAVVRPPSMKRLRCITLRIYDAYLQVTRQLQTDYWLEPAGSHGVWGLDDYHCLPFYFGACQLQSLSAGGSSTKRRTTTRQDNTTSVSYNNYNFDNDDDDDDMVDRLSTPDCIHDDTILRDYGDQYMYLGCIRYIKTLKKGVPFFESSPMLNDISKLGTWDKISSGLLRLYDGDVLSKRQVVQHFVFGNIFHANWIPSQIEPNIQPPNVIFRTPPPPPPGAAVGASSTMIRAPWANNNSATTIPNPPRGRGSTMASSSSPMPPTRAPWAK